MATNTATSFTNHTANGTAGPYAISFDYLEQSDVDVTVNGTLQALGVKYTFTSGTQITFTSGNEPANGAAIVIKRDTNISAKKVDFQDGSVLTETDLDTNTEQLLFGLQEFTDKINAIEDSATSDQTNAEIRAAVEAATDSNVFTDADHSKLDGLTSSIDAVLNSDLDGKGELLVGDGSGDPSALPVGTDGYVLKADSSEPTGLKWSLASANAPIGGGVSAGVYGSSTQIPILTINSAQQISSITLTSFTSTTAATLATPRTIAGVSFDGSANISLNNNAITNGAGYIDGSALNAANLSSGTIPNARFPATLPAASAANLTAIPAANITGALPALDGSALTGISGGVTVQEEGSSLSTAGTTLNFVGSGVTASGTGATKTITIAASGLSDVVNDTTPQLGGDLDMNSKFISSGILGVKNAGAQSELRLYCESSNAHYASLKAPAHADFSGNITYTLPSGYGSNGQVLKSNGSGGTSWVNQTTDTNTTYSAGTGLSLSGTTFSVDTLNQNTTGSAATLTTPRAINGVNFDGSAAITVADSTKMPLTGGTFSAEVIFQKEITETVFAITDASSVALDPINGMIQTWTLGANRTATDSLTTGQSMLLIIIATASNYTMTWPTMKWKGGSAPTLGGNNRTAIELFKVGSDLFGATIGDLS